MLCMGLDMVEGGLDMVEGGADQVDGPTGDGVGICGEDLALVLGVPITKVKEQRLFSTRIDLCPYY